MTVNDFLQPDQAAWILELLNHPNTVIQTFDTKKLRTSLETKELLERIAKAPPMRAVPGGLVADIPGAKVNESSAPT